MTSATIPHGTANASAQLCSLDSYGHAQSRDAAHRTPAPPRRRGDASGRRGSRAQGLATLPNLSRRHGTQRDTGHGQWEGQLLTGDTRENAATAELRGENPNNKPTVICGVIAHNPPWTSRWSGKRTVHRALARKLLLVKTAVENISQRQVQKLGVNSRLRIKL